MGHREEVGHGRGERERERERERQERCEERGGVRRDRRG